MANVNGLSVIPNSDKSRAGAFGATLGFGSQAYGILKRCGAGLCGRRDESAATAGYLARDGDCEKIRYGISAAARCVSLKSAAKFKLYQIMAMRRNSQAGYS